MVSIKIQISANEGSAAWDFPMKDSELADKLRICIHKRKRQW